MSTDCVSCREVKSLVEVSRRNLHFEWNQSADLGLSGRKPAAAYFFSKSRRQKICESLATNWSPLCSCWPHTTQTKQRTWYTPPVARITSSFEGIGSIQPRQRIPYSLTMCTQYINSVISRTKIRDHDWAKSEQTCTVTNKSTALQHLSWI